LTKHVYGVRSNLEYTLHTMSDEEIIQVVDDRDEILYIGLSTETKEGSHLGLESIVTFFFNGDKLSESLGWAHLKSS
jgi:hypothetical protein